MIVKVEWGGMFAQRLRGYNKILVNPSFHVSRLMRSKLGINKFLSARTDGATHYEITTKLCDRYEELERTQFEGITDAEREITLGLFGIADDVVNCMDEYQQHYTRCKRFYGGHRLSEDNIKFTLLYDIEKYRESLRRLEVNHSATPLLDRLRKARGL